MSPKLIVMIVADQLRADHLGFGGLTLGHTPNLDRLAARGAVFERTHVTNPVCMPSRATLATGRWPSVHGTRSNGIPLDPSAETVMSTLRRAGWSTAAVGKLHFQPMGWPFEPFQLDEIKASDPGSLDPTVRDAATFHRSGLGSAFDWEESTRHRDELVTMPDDYYGFESVDLVIGHGDRASGHYVHWLRQHGVEQDEVAGHDQARHRSELWDQVWESRIPAELSTSAYVAEKAIAQIEGAAQSDSPTFLLVSFPDPHHPFCPPAPYASVVDPRALDLPGTFHQAPDRLPPHLRLMLDRPGHPHPDPTFTFAATEAQYREAMAAQVGLLAQMDDAIGRVLAAIDREGGGDDTVVLFTSDHGDLFGDHGLMLKHYTHYEAVTRVPLVIAGEGWTGRPKALVSNADVAPTLLELAGVTPFRGIQGRSLLPLRGAPDRDHRDAVLVEEDQPVGVDGLPAPVRMRTLITDEGRLTLYHGQPFAELYDHQADPDETVNLHRRPDGAGLEHRLRARMLDELVALADQGRRIHHSA